MSQDKKFKPEGKKSFPLVFLILLFGVLASVFTIQTMLRTKQANISFSYQVEHLINLHLLDHDESKKVAVNDNLVSFSGKFLNSETEESQNRYNYLELIHQKNSLLEQKEYITSKLDLLEKDVISAVEFFYSIYSRKEEDNKDTKFIVKDFYNTKDRKNSISINLPVKECVDFSFLNIVKKIDQIKLADINKATVQLNVVHKDLTALVAAFRSENLGIGSELIKSDLKKIEAILERIKDEKDVNVRFNKYSGIISNISEIIEEVIFEKKSASMLSLRSVRSYLDEISKLEQINLLLDKNYFQLEEVRKELVGATWFFNNQEISNKALEKQEVDIFNNWFQSAKIEWMKFYKNKGLFFKAPDQPRNIALEKNFKSQYPTQNYLGYVLTILPIVFVLLLLYLVFARQMKGMGGTAMTFGKSPARLLQKGKHKVTFKDVAGIDEAKEELVEIVDFLKNPDKFTALGGRIPKGILLIGSPGTGKTLVAKALAGEADRPFFSIAGSDFVEMFVGVGASRIRDMFEQAKKSAPCIIFIDEIDAVGRHRGGGVGGGHDEREQTLNQLLVEMDGFDTNEGVILMAATNRPDVLDKALLRPGRFDRRVVISLPDIKGRFEILKVHVKKIKMDQSVDLMAIARGTPGVSGADLQNLLNEAALLAARNNRTAVTAVEVSAARDKVLYGKERRSLEIDEREKETTAFHEAGHTVAGWCVENADPVDKVTIIPRGLSLGATHFLPKKNKLSYWKKELLDQLIVLMGGRAAEEIFVGDLSSGAQQDIAQATKIARSMVCQWGMDHSIGAVAYEEVGESSAYGYGSYHERTYSEETAVKIDAKVIELLNHSYEQAKNIINSKKVEAELLTKMLIEFETLCFEDISDIMSGNWNVDKKRARIKDEDNKYQFASESVTEEKKDIDTNKDKE